MWLHRSGCPSLPRNLYKILCNSRSWLAKLFLCCLFCGSFGASGASCCSAFHPHRPRSVLTSFSKRQTLPFLRLRYLHLLTRCRLYLKLLMDLRLHLDHVRCPRLRLYLHLWYNLWHHHLHPRALLIAGAAKDGNYHDHSDHHYGHHDDDNQDNVVVFIRRRLSCGAVRRMK